MTREHTMAGAAGAVALVAALGLGGWAAAGAPHRGPSASEGRLLEVRYEVLREPAYVPPPPSEATRLDVLSAEPPTAVEEGVLAAQAGAALRLLQAQDAARAAAALAVVRADDARIDRETAAALAEARGVLSASSESQPDPSPPSAG